MPEDSVENMARKSSAHGEMNYLGKLPSSLVVIICLKQKLDAGFWEI